MVNPTEYAKSNYMQRKITSQIIEKFAEELKKISGECMDVGCGSGNTTKDILLPALHPNAVITGTDISDIIIKYATETYGDKRLKFEILDIQTKDLPDKYVSRFAHISSFFTLHWCCDIKQTFENIYHMLLPGANMLIIMIAQHFLFDILEMFLQDVPDLSHIDIKKCIVPFHYSHQPYTDLIKLLNEIGFQIRHCSLQEQNFLIKDLHKVLSSIVLSATCLNQISNDQIENCINNCIKEFMKNNSNYVQLRNDPKRIAAIDTTKLFVIYAEKATKETFKES